MLRTARAAVPNTKAGSSSCVSCKLGFRFLAPPCKQMAAGCINFTHMKSSPYLLTEDDYEPIEPDQEEKDDHKSVGHDLVAGFHLTVMLL